MRWPKGGWKNTSSHESGGDTRPQDRYHSNQGPYFRGGGPDDRGLKSGQGPSKTETQKQTIPKKSGETGSVHPHSRGGMAPGGGGGSSPPGGGGPQMIKGVMTQIRRKMRKRILMRKLNQ